MKLHVDGKTYEYDIDRMTNTEGIAIEKVTGLYFGDWATALSKGSMLAVTALVWVIQKRAEPTLRWDDVSFELASIEIDQDEIDQDEGQGKAKTPDDQAEVAESE